MKHKMEINSELILNVTRILILLSYFGNQKTVKMTLNKIMMFDFYMKYPRVMIENTEIIDNNFDYYDYYSYYHWKPSRDEYHLYLRYLSAKRLITRSISKNDFIYQINKEGIDVVENLNSSYSVSLKTVAVYIKKNVSKLSDGKIESEIIKKSLSKLNN